MVEISLTEGKSVLVDDCDSHLNNFHWFVSKHGNRYYARHSKRNNGDNGYVLMHHAILGFPLNGKMVDHKNGNGLDNRRENINIVTPRQNSSNTWKHRDGIKSSKYVGVCFERSRGKWKASIFINGKDMNLGRFGTELKAHLAYENKLKYINVNDSN